MDIHARIQQFLQDMVPSSSGRGWRAAPGEGGAKSISPHPNPLLEGEEIFTKAGLVPFTRHPYRYYVMKPVAAKPELGAPEFQLCKGTREGNEIPVETALREGIEELGMKLEHINQLYDLGSYEFFSATTGKAKAMRLFAAEMLADDFSADVAASTAERAWLTLSEFDIAGREDHRYILRDIERKLVLGAW